MKQKYKRVKRTLRIDALLYAAIKDSAKKNGVSVNKETQTRLHDSFYQHSLAKLLEQMRKEFPAGRRHAFD